MSDGEQGATSKPSKTKKAKIVENEEKGLTRAFNKVGDKLATMTITHVAKSDNELFRYIFESVNNLLVSTYPCIIPVWGANPLTLKLSTTFHSTTS